MNPEEMKNLPPITKEQRLKVFAFLTVAPEILPILNPLVLNKMYLTLSSGFDIEEAMEKNRADLIRSGQTPETLCQGYQHAWKIFEELVPPESIKNMVKQIVVQTNAMAAGEITKVKGMDAEAKSREQLCSYVRYVFANASDDQKEIAEQVINNFNQEKIHAPK